MHTVFLVISSKVNSLQSQPGFETLGWYLASVPLQVTLAILPEELHQSDSSEALLDSTDAEWEVCSTSVLRSPELFPPCLFFRL